MVLENGVLFMREIANKSASKEILAPSKRYARANAKVVIINSLLSNANTASGGIVEVTEKTLRVSKIKDGTVIDHITGGHALDVINILGIRGRVNGVVTVAMNVPSKTLHVKDMVKIEGRELKSEEVDKIALLAPHATINIIRDYKLAEKQRVKLPNVIRGIVKCANPACISNSKEPVQPTFYVDSEDPLLLRCHYCGYIMEKQDILKQF